MLNRQSSRRSRSRRPFFPCRADRTGGAPALVALALTLLVSCAPGSDIELSSESPGLAEFMNWEADTDRFVSTTLAIEQQAELAVANCMRSGGFEYSPRPITEASVFGVPIGGDLTEAEYAASYGFGISTVFDDMFEQTQPEDNEPLGDDPNAATLGALTESEREAWFEALRGPGLLVDPETGELIDPLTGKALDDGPPVDGGCTGQARSQAQGHSEQWVDIENGLAKVEEEVDADPRMVNAFADWSECMASQGAPFANLQAVYDELWSKYLNLQDDVLADNDLGPSTESREITESSSRVPELTPGQAERLAQLQQVEIRIATVHLECSKDLEGVRESVTYEYEAQFVHENRETLSTLRGSS